MSNLKIQIKQADFEGPLDLLLELILARKLSINKISLAQISEEFIKQLEHRQIKKEDIADFLELASQLLYIKSKSLLPIFENDDQDEFLLEKKLKLLKFLKDFAREYKAKKHYDLFSLDLQKDKDFKLTISEQDIQRAKEKILSRLPKINLKQVNLYRKKLKSADEALRELSVKLRLLQRIDLLSEYKNRDDLVVAFLASLELARSGSIKIYQRKNSLQLELNKIDMPFYGYNK